MNQKIYIGPYESGLEKSVEPFMLPKEAFTTLEDSYVWRGRVKKKDGYTFLGRLHTDVTLPDFLGNTAGAGTTFTGTLAQAPVSPGTVTITIGGVHTLTDNGNGTLSAATGTSVFGIIDYESGLVTLTIDPGVGAGIAVNATAYKELTRQPVMGLALYDTAIVNQEDLVAFDQNTSYLFNTATGIFEEIAGTSWNSTDSDLFWSENYTVDAGGNKLLWATNNIAYNVGGDDGIQYYNGTAWTLLAAQIDAIAPNPNYLRGSLLLVAYRDRLVALNTLEGPTPAVGAATRFQNRARWSQNGTPLVAVDANAWREDIVGKGGYIDAPTSEAIVSAGFIRDTLVVFFERSTWRLRYTGNELLPFIWEQINTEYGAESTFSTVLFDKGILSIGDKRIVIADTNNVEPIDQKIPDEVYNIHNDNDGPKRVFGIRDFFRQLVYWAFPNDDPNETFPDKVLVYNYVNNAWAIYNDSFTTFGRWQKRQDYSWATLPYATWAEWTNAWGDPRSQSFFPNIVAGNQKGNVVILDNTSSNDFSLDLVNSIATTSISNTSPAIFHIPDHNLKVGQFVRITDCPAFAVSIVNEASGTALTGSTQFIGTLVNIGLFPGTLTITVGANNFVDLGNGTLSGGTGGSTINYETGEFILNFGALGADTPVLASYDYNIINYRVLKVVARTTDTFQLAAVNTDGSLSPINFGTFGAPFAGTGKVAVISNFNVVTKRFSPHIMEEKGLRISFVDVFLKKSNGDFTAAILADQDSSVAINSFVVSSSDEVQAGLSPEKVWKRIFANAISNFIQLRYTMSDYQVTQFENYSAEWELHAQNILVSKSGRITGGA